MFGHVDVGGEVGRNDGVEKDEDTQRQPEEQADDREEEGLRPGRVHVCGAAGVGGVLLVVGDGEDGGGEEDGETPGDEADQSGLSEEISRLCSHWSSSYFTGLSLVETFIVLKYFHRAKPGLICLVLGPDQSGPQWETYGVVPSILRYWNITLEYHVLCIRISY